MIPRQLDERFSGALPFLEQLKKNVTNTLAAFADDKGYPFVGRIKALASVAEKIEMGRYARFSEIDDLVAFTLVIPTAAMEANVIEFCRLKFDVTEIRHKRNTAKSPEAFRFDSTRVIARVRRPADVAGQPGPSIADFLFEIQVRTAFEHAWSVATHDLVYKGSSIDWRRIRLASQLKASSESLDAAVAAFDQLAEAIEPSQWEKSDEQGEISNFVERLFREFKLPGTLKPASSNRFAENLWHLTRAARPNLSSRSCVAAIEDELNKMKQEEIPVSLSLYQFFLGILCRRGLISSVKNLHCHVTPELEALFPATKGIGSSFDYAS